MRQAHVTVVADTVGEAAPPPASTDDLRPLAAEIRRRTLAACLEAGTGHVGGCSAAVELFTALYFGAVLRYEPGNPRAATRDLVAVRGHLGPVRYAVFSLLGWTAEDELGTYATLGSRLQGHETTDLPGVDFGPSGSLGMLLSYGLGSAIVAADRAEPRRTFVFLGDGEEQEGNVAEAARHAAAIGVRGLVAVIDANGRQLSGPVRHTDVADLAMTWAGYGWTVVDLPDGNDLALARSSLDEAARRCEDGPVVVVARTTKGYGIPGAETHFSGYHELSHCDAETVRSAIGAASTVALPANFHMTVSEPSGTRTEFADVAVDGPWPDAPDDFQLAYLGRLADTLAAIDTGTLYFLFADTFPEPLLARTGLARQARCYNVGVREQHLVALAHGIAAADPHARIIGHTGDAFVLRAADQLAASAGAGSRLVLLGDDAGLTNCRNGSSHQSSYQPLLLADLPGVHLLEPADGADFAAVMNHALAASQGVHYVRIHDSALALPVPTSPSERTIDSYVVRDSGPNGPDVLIAASGFLVGEALVAERLLSAEGISATVINVVDPADGGGALADALRGGAPVLTAYDGHPEMLARTVRHLAGRLGRTSRTANKGFIRGTSGRLVELVSWLELDGDALADAARDLVRQARGDSARTTGRRQ